MMSLKNLIKLEILVLCLGFMIGDVIVLLKTMGGFTPYGLGTFFIAAVISDIIINDFEQIKSIQSYRPKHAKDTERK